MGFDFFSDKDNLLINFNESILKNEDIIKLNDFYFNSTNAINIKKLKPLYDKLNIKVSHLYISLSTKSEGFGKHNDKVDVWDWQCKGLTFWKGDNFEYILNPGDLIYIPKGVNHQVISLSPRAGLSMSKE